MIKGQVNDRIIKEIRSIDAPGKVKSLLEKILAFELDIMDKGRPSFKPDYERMINEVLLSDSKEAK